MGLLDDALQIKNETTAGANTAERVGSMFQNILQQNVVRVGSLSDFPDAVSGVITLEADTTYFTTTTIDLEGARLVGASNTCLLGTSSENSYLTSTGLGSSTALFTTSFTTPIRHLSFLNVGTALNIDGDGNSAAYDWTGVNFLNVPTIGVIKNFTNLILTKCAFINSNKLTLDGTFDTFGVEGSLISGNGALGNIINIPSTATITRRFRIIYSAVIAILDTTAIAISDSANIPVEGVILDTVNFAGGGTYVSGIDFNNNKTLFTNCKGITNSRNVSQYYMSNNAVATDIVTIDVPVKVTGITTDGALTSKFVNTDNRATYVGAFSRIFKITTSLSVVSGNNNLIGCYIAKNGSVLGDSEVYSTTSGTGKSEGVTIQTLVELDTNDYIEIFVENKSGTTDVTVTDMNVIIF